MATNQIDAHKHKKQTPLNFKLIIGRIELLKLLILTHLRAFFSTYL